MKLYLDHNNLWVKVATDQKAESLVAGVLSKLDNKTNNKSISNKKYAEFSTKWLVLLRYHSTTCAYNYPFNLVPKNPKSVPLLQSIFTSLFTSQLSLKSTLTISFLYLSNFSPPYFCIQTSQQSTPKMFSLTQPYNQFTLREETRELGSLVRTDTLFSPFLIKVWTVIAGLTTTDSLSPRLRKLVYCMQLLMKMYACNRNGKLSNPPSLISLDYFHYFHTLLIPSEELIFP